MQFAAVISKLNLPFSVADKHGPAIKVICADAEVVKKLKCNRTKCTAVVKNVIGRTRREELIELLRENRFSLMVDESSIY